jgi:drug/metabolite transporter (DMT)-like permease
VEVGWISIAILSAALLGLVNIFDSHLITRRMPSLRAYLFLVGFMLLASGLLFAYLFPLPAGLSSWRLLVAITSGILRAGSVTILLYTLKTEEVSRAVPVVSIYPVFVALMAVPLLGETLGYLHWLAIAIVVAGVVMVSIKRNPGGRVRRPGGIILLLLLAASLLLALADVTGKYAISYISFWNMYWLSIAIIAVIFLLISLRPRVLKELGSLKRPASALTLVAITELLVVAGAVLFFWAMENGPVSLVSTIASTRPIFVVVYALILSRIWPNFLVWQPGRLALGLKLVAAVLIAGGIAVIYLA